MRLDPLLGRGPVKWVATLAHVREVSLLGRADLAFWKDRLAHEELVPAQRDGQAQILITAADSRFKGIRFREVSFCVLVSLAEDPAHSDAAFLLHAYNSSRFFAFCERAFFSTPYEHAAVRVETSHPCRISVARGGEEIFRAAMPGEATAIARAALPVADDGWEGPVFLPRRQAAGTRRVFFARINGRTRKYAFQEAQDSLALRPARGAEVLQALVDSRIRIDEWIIRDDATHAKSKTYRT